MSQEEEKKPQPHQQISHETSQSSQFSLRLIVDELSFTFVSSSYSPKSHSRMTGIAKSKAQAEFKIECLRKERGVDGGEQNRHDFATSTLNNLLEMCESSSDP